LAEVTSGGRTTRSVHGNLGLIVERSTVQLNSQSLDGQLEAKLTVIVR
jgi:hypothetical protein